MPLTKKGKEILKTFKKQYGEKKGERIFYSSINKGILPKNLEGRYYKEVKR